MGINNISVQPKAMEKNDADFLKSPQRYTLPPQKPDTVELSTKKPEQKKNTSSKAKAFIAATAAILATVGIYIGVKNKAVAKKAVQETERLAKEATEKLAKEAAEKAAKEAEAKAVKEATEKLAKEAAEKAAKEAEAKAVKEAAEKAAKEAEAKATKEVERLANIETENLKQLEIFKKDVQSLSNDEIKALRETNRNEMDELITPIKKRNSMSLRITDDMTVEEKLKCDLLSEKYALLLDENARRHENLLQKYLFRDTDKKVKSTYADKYLNQEEQQAFGAYYDTCGYNSSLRKGADPKSFKEVVLMDSGFAKAPALEEEAVVYRAVHGHPIFKEQQQFINSLKEGTVINDPAFISTSTDATNAQFRQFAESALESDGVLMRIRIPKGTKGVNGGFNEYLLPRNSQIKINNIEVVDGHKIADCEYILPKEIEGKIAETTKSIKPSAISNIETNIKPRSNNKYSISVKDDKNIAIISTCMVDSYYDVLKHNPEGYVKDGVISGLHIVDLNSTGGGMGTQAIKQAVTLSQKLGEEGRIWLQASVINKAKGTPVPFYHKLGFQAVDKTIETEIIEGMKNLENTGVYTGPKNVSMFLPVEKIADILAK